MIMKALGVLLIWMVLSVLHASPVLAGPFHCTPQQIKNGTCAENPFPNYGQVGNTTCSISPKGVCAAAEAINSFTFLKNTYPKVYGSTSIDTGPEKTSAAAANDFASNGWTSGGTTYKGYYDRFNTDGPNKQYFDYLMTKEDWFQSFAPNTTRFDVRGKEADLPKADQVNPNAAFLLQQIMDGEDVELFIQSTQDSTATKHAISLVGVSWTPSGKKDKGINCRAPQTCAMDFQDPNMPAQEGGVPISLNNGILSFDYMNATWQIVAAFAESPKGSHKVPEPSSGLTFVVALGALGLFIRRSGKLPA